MSHVFSIARPEPVDSVYGNLETHIAAPAPHSTWRKFGVVALMLPLIAGGIVAFGELAIGQQKPKAPATARAAIPTPATPAPTPAAASALVSAPAAPEKLNNTTPAWTVSCVALSRAAVPDCRIEQRLFVKETGRAISIAMVDVPGATRQPVLLMHLPNSLALQDGVALSIDGGAATPLLWQSCDGNGCHATLALTPALIDAMKNGKVLAVRVVAANQEVLTFQHLLTDFALAFEAAK